MYCLFTAFFFQNAQQKKPQLWRAFYLCKQTICICIFVISIAQLKLARNLLCICTSNSPPITTLEEDKKMENYGEGGGGGGTLYNTHTRCHGNTFGLDQVCQKHTHMKHVCTQKTRGRKIDGSYEITSLISGLIKLSWGAQKLCVTLVAAGGFPKCTHRWQHWNWNS